MWCCRALASVVVAEAFDVILPKIVAALDFDENERFVTNVGDAMFGAEGNEKNLASTMISFNIVEREAGTAGNDHPKLFSTLMTLVREPRAWIHRDALHLMRIGTFEDIVPAPGTDVFC